MTYTKINDTIVLRVCRGESLVEAIRRTCDENNVTAAEITGIGAADKAEVGVYEPRENRYVKTNISEDCEICALCGNASVLDGKTYLHLHITLAGMSGRVYGGHMYDAVISMTAEIIIRVLNAKMERVYDEKLGINLLDV